MQGRSLILTWSALAALALLAGCASAPRAPAVESPPSPTPSPPASISPLPSPTSPPSRLLNLDIPAPSRGPGMLGEPAEGQITVYLPPSYYSAPERRYPVVYYLPGFGDASMLGVNLPQDVDRLVSTGAVKELILVTAPGKNALGGSFYVNSPVTGNWEDYIVKDVVGYVDAHYRTLANPAARGIAGHSMGGFGALNIAMRHPDVFAAVYALSPGLYDENGLAESQMFAEQDAVDAYLAAARDLAGLPPGEAAQAMRRLPAVVQFTLAYGAAFSPDPNGPPPWVAYPIRMQDGQREYDARLWQAWERGFGGIKEKAAGNRDNWLKLKGIAVDCGQNDEYKLIPKGCHYFAEQMTVAGIPLDLDMHEGTHKSLLGQRIQERMLPFFTKLLAS